MKRRPIPLAALIATAFAGSAPATRADVKADVKAPGDVPKGEAQVSKKHRKGGAVEEMAESVKLMNSQSRESPELASAVVRMWLSDQEKK